MDQCVGIPWQVIVSAFQNDDEDLMFFLNKATGEIFAVESDFSDDDFWRHIENNSRQFLQIPHYDYDQERQLMFSFIRELTDDNLKSTLEKCFKGKDFYGKTDDILSFYPEEQEQWNSFRENLITSRIRSWLEENDIYTEEFTH